MKHLSHSVGACVLALMAVLCGTSALTQPLHITGAVSASGTTVAYAAITFTDAADPARSFSTTTDEIGDFLLDIHTAVTTGTAPASFRLDQNYPNPFTAATVFSWTLDHPAGSLITIYDLLGREVRRFELGLQDDGAHELVWDGLNSLGERIAPGAYFYRLQAGDQVQVRKMICFPGQSAAAGFRSCRPAAPAAGASTLAKSAGTAATLWVVRISNTAMTSPRIVPKEFPPAEIEDGAVRMFEVEKERYVPLATVVAESARQIIRGFGAANIVGWRPDMTTAQINTAFGTGAGQLGFSILRLRVPPDSLSFRQQVATAKAASQKGVTIIASPWTPPAWMKTNHNLVGGKLRTDCYAAFARHLDSFVDYMAQNGAPLYAVSVQNEPDVSVTYESCDYDGADMLKFMRENAPAVGARVMAPEGCNFARSLADPILKDSLAMANLGMFCGHFYGPWQTNLSPGISRNKEVWMTEHLVLDTTWVEVLGTGKEIHDCMMADMSAYVWWYIVRYYGPIHENGTVTKRGYVMSQFARFIRPGYYRVDITEKPQAGVFLSAYRDGANLVIVAINSGNQAAEQPIEIPGSGATGFTPYVTSRGKNCAAGGLLSVSGGTFTAVLEASSITTFVSQ